LYQRDYLMRMIEQFSMTLGQVLFKRRNQQFAEAMELLTQAMKQLLGLNSKLVLALSVKDLMALLTTQGQFDAGKGLLLSDMLKAEGDLLVDAAEEDEGIACYMKSLELLLEMRWMQEASELEQEMEERIQDLLTIIKPGLMPLRILKPLVHYYESTGRLAKAEDTLFFILDADEDQTQWIDSGLHMVERWQKMSTDELALGELNVEEVQETYTQLVKMKQKASKIERM
jgi:tetratricopeptide (TPR) repeat protein